MNGENDKIGTEGENGKNEYSFPEPPATSQFSCTSADVITFRVQTSANVVHATECEDRTPRTRATDDHFLMFFSTRDSCAPCTKATSLAQERVEHSSLRFHNSHPLVTCFVVTCMLGVPDPSPPVLSTPPLTQPFTADWNRLCLRRSHGAVHCLAEWLNRASLTGHEPKNLIEVSREHTHIDFPSRKNSFSTDVNDLITTVAASDLADVTAEPLTSPLFTQEREVSANPFGVSDFRQAAASGSQQQQAFSGVVNLWQTLNVGSFWESGAV